MTTAMSFARARRRRAQFSLEALVLLAAYFMFVALLVSAVGGQAREQALASKVFAPAAAARPGYPAYGIIAFNDTLSCIPAALNGACISSGSKEVLGWR